MSLVSRLFLLILLSTAPVLIAELFTQSELRRERAAAARAESVRYTRLVASDATGLTEGMKGILIAISQAPSIRSLNLPLCSSYLENLTRRYPQLFNITLIDDGGTPVCANTPIVAGATARDRFYFHEAMRRDDFVIGNYIVGRTIPQPQLPMAMPFTDDSGRRFVISIGIKPDWLQQRFGGLALPPGATILIADSDSRVVVAPSNPGLVGKPLPAEFAAANQTREDTFEWTDNSGQSHLASFEPLLVAPVGLIVIVDLLQGDVLSAAAAAAQRDVSVLVVSILAAIGLAAVGARYILTRPLRILTSAAENWSNGRFHVRAGLTDKTSEIGRLGIAFDRMADVIEADQLALRSMNETLERSVDERTAELSAANRMLAKEMTERQAAEAALLQAQKMEAIGQLAGGIAHDFNNLLTAIGGSIEFLAKAVPAVDERAQRFAQVARESVQRAARMTHRLLAFSRQQPLEMQTVELNRLVSGMSELLQRTLGETVKVETVLAGGLWLTRTDPVQLENALLNLAINGRDAMPQGGQLTIETANASLDSAYAAAHTDVAPGQYVMLAVTDTGTGMSQETIARAFDPFFTTKPAGRGTGLGLSMIYGFAKQTRGHIKIYSELGVGTTVKLYLPRVMPASDTAVSWPEATQRRASTSGGETVLVVEDDEAVRELSTAFLRELGYAVFATSDAATALDLLRGHPEIAVLFTDVVLAGGVSGRQLADRARREKPDLPVLFTTGYTPNAIIHGGILDPGVHLLPKPFTAEALGAAIRELLDTAI